MKHSEMRDFAITEQPPHSMRATYLSPRVAVERLLGRKYEAQQFCLKLLTNEGLSCLKHRYQAIQYLLHDHLRRFFHEYRLTACPIQRLQLVGVNCAVGA